MLLRSDAVVQGGINPCSFSLLGDLFSQHRRGVVFGTCMTTAGMWAIGTHCVPETDKCLCGRFRKRIKGERIERRNQLIISTALFGALIYVGYDLGALGGVVRPHSPACPFHFLAFLYAPSHAHITSAPPCTYSVISRLCTPILSLSCPTGSFIIPCR